MTEKKSLIEIRLLVSYLGEKDQCNWWDSQFLTTTGLSFLEISFPRTPYIAAYTSISNIAEKTHEKAIAKDGSVNLFKLPGQLEEQITKYISNTQLEDFFKSVTNKELALQKLKSYFKQAVTSPTGAVQVGKVKDILTPQGISEMAAHYYDAFLNGKKVFPYFN